MSKIDLGLCIQGPNLNLRVVRGFAPLGRLALISRADEYDQLSNEAGIQRTPAAKHAKEALHYALEANLDDSEGDPRAFPEVILNVRDLSVLEIYDFLESGLTKDSLPIATEYEAGVAVLGVRINLDKLNTSPIGESEPQISRVDGNHRLLQATKLMHAGEYEMDDFPEVPFALYVGLNPDQERKIFKDINGNHKAMNKSLLIKYSTMRLNSVNVDDRLALPARLGASLSDEGMIFNNMVNFGGNLSSYRFVHNGNPPLTLVGVTNAMKEVVKFGNVWVTSNQEDYETIKLSVNAFFTQVRAMFPAEWVNVKDFVIIKSLGLGSLSMLAGTIFNNFDAKGEQYSEEIVNEILQSLRKDLDFNRFKWQGYTGQSALKQMYKKMVEVASEAGHSDYVQSRFDW